jgi:hypothetical protein
MQRRFDEFIITLAQDEAVHDVREAIRLCLEVREELTLPLTGEVRRIHVASVPDPVVRPGESRKKPRARLEGGQRDP